MFKEKVVKMSRNRRFCLEKTGEKQREIERFFEEYIMKNAQNRTILKKRKKVFLNFWSIFEKKKINK